MKKIITILTLGLLSSTFANEMYKYKKAVLDLSAENLWKLTAQKYESKKVWYFTDKPIPKSWSGIAACRIEDERTSKDSTCDYFFKSSHPNNRFIGDYPYNSASEGYPHHPDKIPSGGCMDVVGLKGKCTHQKDEKLCGISKDVKVVLKKYVEVAFNDKSDPCGLYEFAKTKHIKAALEYIESLKNPEKEIKKGP